MNDESHDELRPSGEEARLDEAAAGLGQALAAQGLAERPEGANGDRTAPDRPDAVRPTEPWRPEDFEKKADALLVRAPKLLLKHGRGVELEHLPMEDELAQEVAEDLAPLVQAFWPKGQHGSLVVHGTNLVGTLATYAVAVVVAVRAAEDAQEDQAATDDRGRVVSGADEDGEGDTNA